MSKVEWSDEQPPEWNPAPAFPPQSDEPNPLGLGALLSETWEQVVANIGFAARHFVTAFLVSVGLGLSALGMIYLFVTPDAAFLDFVYSQSVPVGDTEVTNSLLGSAAFVALVTLLSTIPQFWYTSIMANRFLDSNRTTASGWGRLLLTNFLLALWILLALTPSLAVLIYGIVLESVEFTGMGGLLVLISVGLLLYYSLGFIPLTGVVLAENLSGNAALRRSLALSKHSRFSMFVPLAVVTILVAIATSAISQFGVLITDILLGLIGYVFTNAITILLATLFSASVSISIYRNQLRK